jgi:hypothetical protein
LNCDNSELVVFIKDGFFEPKWQLFYQNLSGVGAVHRIPETA